MSYHVFFSLSTGLSKPMRVPKGTFKRIIEHIAFVEETLGLERTPTYTPEDEKQRPGWHWRDTQSMMRKHFGKRPKPIASDNWSNVHAWDVNKERMASTVRNHNGFVRSLYEDLQKWSKTKFERGTSEKITPAQAHEFWGGLSLLDWPKDLWTKAHFTDHMEHLYELLSKGASRGVTLGCKPFKPKQVSDLIRLFEDALDDQGFDLRFDIPLDANLQPYDRIACSHNGGYDWCSYCGPINSDDFHARCAACPRAKNGKCELKNEHPGEFE